MQLDKDKIKEKLKTGKVGARKSVKVFTHIILYLFDILIDSSIESLKIIKANAGLFLGSAILVLGLFGFESDKYCDGNTADYLSCTRPTTYYFYDWLDLTLLIIGLFLVIIWFLKLKNCNEN